MEGGLLMLGVGYVLVLVAVVGVLFWSLSVVARARRDRERGRERHPAVSGRPDVVGWTDGVIDDSWCVDNWPTVAGVLGRLDPDELDNARGTLERISTRRGLVHPELEVTRDCSGFVIDKTRISNGDYVSRPRNDGMTHSTLAPGVSYDDGGEDPPEGRRELDSV